MSAMEKATALLLLSGIAAPLAGVLFRRVGGGWESFGRGPLAIVTEPPPRGRLTGGSQAQVDPAIQAAEVRQMLAAKSARRERRGEAPLDVEAEAARLLAEEAESDDPQARMDADLRAEVRQLVIARNERLMRRGQPPLDVEAETERQLKDLVGSDP